MVWPDLTHSLPASFINAHEDCRFPAEFCSMAVNVVAPPPAVARGAGAGGGGKYDGKGMFLAAIQELEVDAAESSQPSSIPTSSSSTFNKVVIVDTREDSRPGVSYKGMLLVMVNQHDHSNRLVSNFSSTSFNPTISLNWPWC